MKSENSESTLDHIYKSTACQHELHDRCRKTCKFCSTGCICACHARKIVAGDVHATPTGWEDGSGD